MICIVAFIFCVLVVRLFVLQGVDTRDLQSKASAQWVRSLSLAARRGSIVDRNGATLAVSYTAYNVYVRPRNIDNIDYVCDVLSGDLGLSRARVYERVVSCRSSEVLIKMKADENEIQRLLKHNPKGVYISVTNDRYYPYGKALSQVLGYMTVDGMGQTGLEMIYDKYLKGVSGYTSVESDVKGIELGGTLTNYTTGLSGLDIKLTIDIGLQTIVENALDNVMNAHLPKSAYAVMFSAKSGQILAMAMTPSLDNNNLPRDNIEELMRLSKNTMIVDVYEPGSTFKIFTTSAALMEGVTSLNDRFYDPGYKIVDGQRIKCWRTIGHGSEDLVEGFCNSCNTVFMELALRLGKDRLYKYLKAFGLGSPTGVDFSGESGGILMDIDRVQNVDLARIGFGQAVAVTPLQMVAGVSCAVNGGTLYQPYFVQSIGNENSINYISITPTVTRRNVVSHEVSSQICQMMEAVVSVKGGKNSFVEGYSIGGKTGTAQKYENGVIASGKYISSFIGTYPANDPEYVLLVCVNEPSQGGYYGSVVAAPVGKEIFSNMFEYYNIPKVDLVEQPKISMPNLIGKSITSAYQELNALGLHFELEGESGVVVGQFPSSETEVYVGSTILITIGESV